MIPRRSAFSITTLALSTLATMTSTPWSIRLLVTSASRTGLFQSPVITT